MLTRSVSDLAFGKEDVFCLDMPNRHSVPRSETTGSFDWPRKLFRESRGAAAGFCVTISELVANPFFG